MFWVLLATFLPVTTALQWTDSLTNNTVMTVCSASDIHLPWNFTLSPDERIEDIKWIYRAEDGSDILIAVYAAGQFGSMPAFSGRVQWTGQGGVVVSQAGVAESGYFTVMVSAEDVSNHLLRFSKTVYVTVSEPPRAQSGALHVHQKAVAVQDNTTRQWGVEVTCGILTSLGHPAIHVVWTTPSGEVMDSSYEDNGTFVLFVPSPVQGGNYSCQLPPSAPAARCLTTTSPLNAAAQLYVDDKDVRLSYLEARQRELEQANKDQANLLQNQANLLQHQANLLLNQTMQISQQNGTIDELKADLLNLTTQFSALTDTVNVLKQLNLASCVDWLKVDPRSGIRTVYISGDPITVYCDQTTDNGGWIVFQRRQDASVDFYRNWTEYRNGFGDLEGNFWLGLDALQSLTTSRRYQLRVDLKMWNENRGYATYSGFYVEDSYNNFTLHYDNFTGGNAGDSLSRQRGQQFTTKDRDHDTLSSVNCAQDFHGAWWYKECHDSNLNADYKTSSSAPNQDGINWKTFGGSNSYSMKFTEMKIRPT